MNKNRVVVTVLSICLMLIPLTVFTQTEVKNLALIANALTNSLSIVDLDDPNARTAVENDIIPLGMVPNDIQVQGDLAYVVNAFSNNVQIIDLRTRTTVGNIPMGDGTQPQQIAFVDSTKAYVTCDKVNEIRVVDLGRQRVVNVIPGGLRPTGVAILNGKAYVTNAAFVSDPITFETTYEDSSVTVIDTQTDTVLKTIPVPTNAAEVITDGDSKVLVISGGDFNLIPGNLVIIDANTDEVERTVNLRTSPGFTLVLDSTGKVFINDGFLTLRGLMIYDLTNTRWIRDRNDAISNLAGGWGLAVDGADNIYVTIPDWTGAGQDELRVMAPDETVTKTYRVGSGASAIALAQIGPPTVVRADINRDGRVNIFDLIVVAGQFGELGNGIAGDVNADGVVDILDLVFIASHFGENVATASLR